MKKEDLNLKKLLKIFNALTFTETEPDIFEPNYTLCAEDYAEYCENIIPNILSLDKFNLSYDIVNIYYSAVNTADNLTEHKISMLEALGKFDKNLLDLTKDKKKVQILLKQFNNITNFTHIVIDNENEEDYTNKDINSIIVSRDVLINYCYLYLFLYISDSLDIASDFSRYSFDPEEFIYEKEENFLLKMKIAELIVNHYSKNKKYVEQLINEQLLKDYKIPDNIQLIEMFPEGYKEMPLKHKQQNTSSKSYYYPELEQDIRSDIIGQDGAIKKITDRLKMVEHGVTQKNGTKAVYMLLGPTGVGKTETVKKINDLLRENETLIRIDMGEYKEKHMGSKILGSPPGYIGHDEENNVLDLISENPNAFILLDEIEKAHPAVLDLFLHMFDEGKAKTNKQKSVDLSNNIFFITSNIGVEENKRNSIGFNKSEEPTHKSYMRSLEKNFRPEFINRINEVVVFDSLSYESVYEIMNLQISEMQNAFKEQKNIDFTFNLSDDVYKFLITNMDYKKYGAREIKRLIEKHIINNAINYIILNETDLSDEITLNFELNDSCIEMTPIIKDKKELKYKPGL